MTSESDDQASGTGTNHLSGESSPYLQQHAHNPVDWHPWGPEALQRARDEDRPILLSTGYAACHWCHVTERASFEDSSIAALMNRHYVNSHVDPEDRPALAAVSQPPRPHPAPFAAVPSKRLECQSGACPPWTGAVRDRTRPGFPHDHSPHCSPLRPFLNFPIWTT